MCGSALALAQLCPRTQYTAASSVTSTTCAPIDLPPPLSVRLFALLICSHQGERKRGIHRHALALVYYFWRPARFCRPTARFSAALPHPVVWILLFRIVFSEGCEEDQASGISLGHLLVCRLGFLPSMVTPPRSRQFKTDHPLYRVNGGHHAKDVSTCSCSLWFGHPCVSAVSDIPASD